MNLSSLKPAEGSIKVKKRLGRGQGSGMGGTSTRGHNGAQSRSGYSTKRSFEGGQMPLQRRIPKFGFKNVNRIEYKAINLDTIQELVEKTNATVIDAALIVQNGMAGKNDLIKLLNRGELKAAVEIKVHAFSASALESVEKVGGKVIKL
jgi:large subunit ribosomal protein L15